MKIEQVAKLSPLERFLYWVRERESIRLRRERGLPKPWTDDTILQKYRFCNVRRMDDKVSQWLYQNWYKPYTNHPNALIACALARFINLPSSLVVIGFPRSWTPETTKRKLRAHRDLGNPIFNGAYMVRGNDGMDKIECVVDYYVQPLYDLRKQVNLDSMEETWKAILPSYGMGSFMAGQIVADLRWAVTGSWNDRFEWAPMGPGSLRGLNRLLGKPLKTPTKQEEFCRKLYELIKECRKHLPRSIFSRLEAMDFQNCLCEYDKYERTLFDGRRPKALFRSEK